MSPPAKRRAGKKLLAKMTTQVFGAHNAQAAKRGPGRPAAGAAKRRNQVACYLTDEELADLDGMIVSGSRGEFLAGLIRTVLGREDTEGS